MAELIRKLSGCENKDKSEVAEWLNNEEQHEVTDTNIVEMLSETTRVSDEEEGCAETIPVTTQTDRLVALEAVLHYVEQQPHVTPSDTLLLQQWQSYCC